MTSRAPLFGWLAAEAVSLTGTRVSMVAIPWFVLTTTGSATQTGIVAFAEMAPYVAMKALAGPLVDRTGARRVSIAADVASVLVVGAIPFLAATHRLSFPLLLALVALAGTLRGPSDGAKQALVPAVVEASGVSMERATGLGGAVERLSSTVGAALAGVLVAAIGPTQALVIDAASFGVSAALLALTAPRRLPTPEAESESKYWVRLRQGWDFLRRDKVLVAMVAMVATTNLLDAAYATVLVPVWARESGGGAAAIGLLFAVFSGAAVLGSVLAATVAERLPRFWTYLIAFLLGGMPRFVVLAFGVPLAGVLAVAVVGGFAVGFINPILGAVMYERIPPHLVGRVTSLQNSLCWAGIPFGGIVGGTLVASLGLRPALVILGAAYLLATMLPALQPQWREIDRKPQPVHP
ncbi:MAG: MFS transporter [Actinomycetota bacterium]|nr:MFS transporter [Actinomycetota bacterium]